MTNKEYQDAVEKEYGRPLNDIMHWLCVEKDVVPTEGASILGVPRNTFVQWRNKFRLGPKQRLSDAADERRRATIQKYVEELQDINLTRPFERKEELSLEGLREVMERYLELYKTQRIVVDEGHLEDVEQLLRIASIEQTMRYIDEYLSGDLHEKYMRDVKFVKALKKRPSHDV